MQYCPLRTLRTLRSGMPTHPSIARRGHGSGVSTIRPRSAIFEETYTISFETIYQLDRQMQGSQNVSISFEDFYRVMLHYTNWTDDDPIAQKVKRAVPQMTMNEALRIVDAARRYGTSIVVTATLEEATACKEKLTRSQLKATMELA